jgi:3-hydroxyisobutyrate dehydrogenase
MGGNMAVRFLAAGYTVYGESRDRRHAQDLVHEGLGWRDTPRDVAESADVLFTSLPDDGALETVARRARVGKRPQVQARTLTIMVGGDEDAYARAEPLLRKFGTPTHIGENGQGLVLKLAINISLAVEMLAFAEGLLVAEGAGVDPKLAVEVMTASAIGSPMLKARAALVLDLPNEAGRRRPDAEDVALALDTARRLCVPLPSAAVADELLTVARGLGYERRDLAALFEVLAELAGDSVRSRA